MPRQTTAVQHHDLTQPTTSTVHHLLGDKETDESQFIANLKPMLPSEWSKAEDMLTEHDRGTVQSMPLHPETRLHASSVQSRAEWLTSVRAVLLLHLGAAPQWTQT